MTDEPKTRAPEAPKKRRKRVCAKHLKVARARAQGMTLQEAGERAGYPTASARASAWEAMETIKRTAPEVFDQHGLTLDSLAEDVDRLRRAKMKRYFHHQGIVLDSREDEALDVQVKAIDMALQVQGAYQKKVEVDVRHDHSIDLTGLPDSVLIGIIGLSKSRPASGDPSSDGRVLPPQSDSLATG